MSYDWEAQRKRDAEKQQRRERLDRVQAALMLLMLAVVIATGAVVCGILAAGTQGVEQR